MADSRWLVVVILAQAAFFAAVAVLCRLTAGNWWPSFMWGLLGVGVVSMGLAWRERVLARRQFDRAP